MHWTEKEIIDQYKAAKKKDAQIEILADQYCCEPRDIKELLERNGIELPKAKAKAKLNKKMETKTENVSNDAENKPMIEEKADINSQESKEKSEETTQECKVFREITLPLGGYVMAALTDAVENYAKEIESTKKSIQELETKIKHLGEAKEEIERFVNNALDQIG